MYYCCGIKIMKISIHMRQRGQQTEQIGQNYLLCHFSFSPAPPSADVVIVEKKSYSRSKGPQQGSVGISAEPQWGRGEYFSPFGTRMHQSGAVSLTWTVSLVVPRSSAIYSKKRFKGQNKYVLITPYPSWHIKSMPAVTEVGAWTWTTTDLFLHSQWIESPRPEVMLTEMEICLQQA